MGPSECATGCFGTSSSSAWIQHGTGDRLFCRELALVLTSLRHERLARGLHVERHTGGQPEVPSSRVYGVGPLSLSFFPSKDLTRAGAIRTQPTAGFGKCKHPQTASVLRSNNGISTTSVSGLGLGPAPQMALTAPELTPHRIARLPSNFGRGPKHATSHVSDIGAGKRGL